MQAPLVNRKTYQEHPVSILRLDSKCVTLAPLSFPYQQVPLCLQIQSKGKIFHYDVSFLKERSFQTRFRYPEFSIDSFHHMANARNEKRFPASFQLEVKVNNIFTKTDVVNESLSGYCIKRDSPITDPIIHLLHEKQKKTAQIRWQKEENGVYWYGLKIIS